MGTSPITKITIIGAGAIGCLFGARLAAGGAEVTLIDSAPVVRENLRARGVVLERAGRVEAVPVAVASEPGAEVQDLVFLLVKRPQTEGALQASTPLIGQDTLVVSLQNGLGTAQLLECRLPASRVVVGVTYMSATTVTPGHVVWSPGETILGSPGGVVVASPVLAAFRESGLDARAVDDLDEHIWAKVALNCGGNPVAALTGLTMGQLLDDAGALGLADGLMHEAVAIADRLGVRVDADERLARHRALLADGGIGKASMLQDVEAGRATEIDAINGELVALADRLGVPAPLNRAVLVLVRSREATGTAPHRAR